MKTLNFFTFLLCILVLGACNKSSNGLNNDVKIDPVNNDTERSFGWSGTEDEAHIQDDILFFGNGSLPSQVDLSQYLPPVGDQGQNGTCVAWAMGYSQKTGMNAQDHNYSPSQLDNPANQASPKDLFWSIPYNEKGEDCNGTSLESAYNKLIERGVADLATVPYEDLEGCSASPEPSWTQKANLNKIENFRQVPMEVDAIKEKLAANHFVGIGANVRDDFSQYTGGVLESNDGGNGGGHALLVVGYDDNKQAFKIVNSWGTSWGENGFVWVDYNLFINDFCKYAFVANNSVNPNPNDDPNPPTSGADLEAEVFGDEVNYDSWNPRDRTVTYNIFNNSTQALSASSKWDAVYLYFNAYDMDDYGVIIHQRMTDEFGYGNGPYMQGLGESANWWYNVNVGAQSNLAEAIFGSWGLKWDYTMPAINGEYYLVMLADAFNVIGEADEEDNIWYVTDEYGDPIEFEDGVGYGFAPNQVEERSSDDSSIKHHTPVNDRNINAYSPEELKFFIRKMKESGQLKRAVERFDINNKPKGVSQ